MNLSKTQKLVLIDWIIEQLEADKLEMLFKEDHSGDMDFESVTSVSDLIIQMEIE
jgi:hypothetical protein